MFSNAWGLGAQVPFPTASHMFFPVWENSGSPQYRGLAGRSVFTASAGYHGQGPRPGWSLRGAASAGHPGHRRRIRVAPVSRLGCSLRCEAQRVASASCSGVLFGWAGSAGRSVGRLCSILFGGSPRLSILGCSLSRLGFLRRPAALPGAEATM